MSDSLRHDDALYRRLLEAGYREDQIEEVYRKLRSKGYGTRESHIKSKRGGAGETLSSIRKRAEEEMKGRGRGNSSSHTSLVSENTAERSGKPAGTGPVSNRAADWVPPIKPRLRRKIDRYAYSQRCLATGLKELISSMLSFFNPSKPDYVNNALLYKLTRRLGYKDSNPYHYSLIDTLDALYYSSRSLLGQQNKNRSMVKPERGREKTESVQKSFRARDPFALSFLSCFAEYRSELRTAIAFIGEYLRSGIRVRYEQLARIVRDTYALILITERVDQQRLERILRLAIEINLAHDRRSKANKELSEQARLFALSYRNLQVFKHELYPLLLKMIASFYSEEVESEEKRRKVYTFLAISPEDILSQEQVNKKQEERIKKQLEEQQSREVERLEMAKEDTFTETFSGIIHVLRSLFPKSGIDRLPDYPYLLPYFDAFVFDQNLVFDHHSYNVENLGREDPMALIVVIHRIIDELFSCLNEYNAEQFLAETGISDEIAELKREWRDIYTQLFNPYLKELGTYAHEGASDDRYAREFRMSRLSRIIEEEINQMRSAAVREYHYPSVLKSSKTYPRLYAIAERLNFLLSRLGESANRGLLELQDPIKQKRCEWIADHPLLDLRLETGDGSGYRKRVVEQVLNYIRAKHTMGRNEAAYAEQIYSIEILWALADLYAYLLSEETSFLSVCPRGIILAGNAEAEEWKKVMENRGTTNLKQLRKELEAEERNSAYIDQLTGMRNKNYYIKELPKVFENQRGVGNPFTVLLMDIDHFKWVNDELGHTKGDEVLYNTSSLILNNIRDGDLAVRYGGEELMVIINGTLHVGIVSAERIRYAQERNIHSSDEYRPILNIMRKKGEPCGTLSIGIAELNGCKSLDELVERADSALYQAKKSRNELRYILPKPGEKGKYDILGYLDYKRLVKLSP